MRCKADIRSAPRAPRLLAALVVTLLALGAGPAAIAAAKASTTTTTAPVTDARTQRQTVRAKRAKVASQLDTIQATSKQVNAALDALEANVSDATKDYTAAKKASLVAASAADDARAELAAKEQQLAGVRSSLRSLALKSYTDDAGASSSGFDIEAVSSDTGLARSGYSGVYASSVASVVDQIRSKALDLADVRSRAEQADALAKLRKTQESQQLTEVQQREAEKQALSDKLESRLEAALSESQSLASLDSSLSAKIAAEDAALARRLAANRSSSAGSSVRGGIISEGETSLVRGIRVATSIAGDLERMLRAASGAGIELSGSGYRDSAAQIAIRRSNCGDSDYAIYDMPPSQCHPPAARPGASMHERGLAIDFTCNGALISSRSNPCYRWLARNAGSYGFANLPSEPWHWSTNGN